MIATRFLIISLLHLVVEINSNGDTSFVNLPLNEAANSTVNFTNDETTETHHTTCKISTERLVANAQATFTRVLTGACNAKTIDERFEKLENSMNKRLEEMKELIVRALSKRWDSSEPIELDYRENRVITENYSSDTIVKNNFLNVENNSLELRDEVRLFNNSVHDISTSDDESKVYTYYWRISNIREKLMQWETARSERSSTFYVGNAGYAMYMKFTPKYFPDGTIFISVGLTKGVHDSKLVWPFPLKIRIKILDLAMHNEPEDRSSRLWDPATICSSYFWGRPGMFGSSDNPECVGLSMPRQLLIGEQTQSSTSRFHQSATINRMYIRDNCLLVELTVHL